MPLSASLDPAAAAHSHRYTAGASGAASPRSTRPRFFIRGRPHDCFRRNGRRASSGLDRSDFDSREQSRCVPEQRLEATQEFRLARVLANSGLARSFRSDAASGFAHTAAVRTCYEAGMREKTPLLVDFTRHLFLVLLLVVVAPLALTFRRRDGGAAVFAARGLGPDRICEHSQNFQ
jgi:hypothetical protein